MYICVKCRIEMNCDKTGVGADFGGGHVYRGDRFKCPTCGLEILATAIGASMDIGHIQQNEYLWMGWRDGAFGVDQEKDRQACETIAKTAQALDPGCDVGEG